MTSHQINFERLTFMMQQDNDLANEIDVETLQHVIEDQVAYRFNTFIAAGCPREVTATVHAPASWRDHIKEAIADNAERESRTPLGRRFGLWLATTITYQTRTNTETVNRNMCPHIQKPDRGRHVEYLIGEPNDGC